MIFKDIANCLEIGREIEFSYAGKNYSITNSSNNRWLLCCDNKMLKNLCGFDEKALLVSEVENFQIEDTTIAQIFNEKKYDVSTLYIL